MNPRANLMSRPCCPVMASKSKQVLLQDHPSVRLSSIAALGYFADPADKPFLTDLAKSDSRLRFAAITALKNYDNETP